MNLEPNSSGRRVAKLFAGTLAIATVVVGGMYLRTPSYRLFILLTSCAYLSVWSVYAALSSKRLNYTLARFVLSTMALVLAVGIFELAAVSRLVDYRRLFVAPAHGINRYDPFRDPSWRIDKELIHIRQPDYVIDGSTVGNLSGGLPNPRQYEVHASYDSNGFRNKKTLDRASIVVIGDSFVEAGLVATDDIASNQLATMLDESVVNLGQCAYGPQQEMIVLQRYGLKLQPKVVTWLFFEGNDLTNIPLYESKIKTWVHTIRAHDGFAQRSFAKNVYNKLASLTSPLLIGASVEEKEKTSGTIKLADGSSETLYFGYPGQPLSEREQESLPTAKQILLDANQLVKDASATMVLVYIPTKFRVYGQICEFPEGSDANQWQAHDLPRQMADWCDDQSISFLDLTPRLQEAAANGELVYVPDDTHWNARGNFVAAEAIADLIERNDWTDNSPTLTDATSPKHSTPHDES